ncbi:MAG TPA: HipA domain-containing protein [Solirubrobacterales bacterium]|nr:HipA domain-containing protein [Solirubrobacterales bacterium]
MQPLDVCLHGERVATLAATVDGGYELAYDAEVVARRESIPVPLSQSMPVRPEPYSPDTTRAFVEGLLPQGPWREELATRLGLDPADGLALLGALGYDCPGAVTFGTADEQSRDAAVATSLVALGGDREKYGLVRRSLGGTWEKPRPGLPSTHVVKPEPDDLPELVANEMFCTAAFRQAGLPAAKATMETIGGRRCLVSQRFDVVWNGGVPERLHQETLCQVLGIAPDPDPGAAEDDAPCFAEAAGLLRALGLEREVSTLIHAAFGNYVLGNGDPHGRNFALLFRGGRIQLALYDLTSTLVYGDSNEVGMVLPDDLDVTTYLLGLCRVAEECGIDPDIFHIQASCALKYVCDAIQIVAERAEAQGWHEPVIDRIFEVAQDRAGRCAERLLLWDHLDM